MQVSVEQQHGHSDAVHHVTGIKGVWVTLVIAVGEMDHYPLSLLGLSCQGETGEELAETGVQRHVLELKELEVLLGYELTLL